jgi:hypothetical protein
MNGRAGEYVLNTPNANMCSVLIYNPERNILSKHIQHATDNVRNVNYVTHNISQVYGDISYFRVAWMARRSKR